MLIETMDLAPLHAASKDAGRFDINALRFDCETGRIVATDGHVLASVPMPVQEDLASFSMALEDARSLSQAIKKAKCPGIVDEPETNSNGRAQVDLPGQRIFPQKVEGTEYPNVKQVVPDFADGCIKVGIGIAVLETILKVAKARGGNALVFRFSKGTEDNGSDKAELCPFTIEGHEDLQLVAMPMRI